ncbi:rRNA maturation RNase YbeY [Vulcanococcus limneticus]|uniref:rRNA maturation RNase YbeY n=1 Tax=Vulcanococcus limneticus TaxID=2170428 RepID=UPI00398BBDF3
MLDLAFRLETTEGTPLAPELAPLLAAAGSLAAGAAAEERWQDLLEGWLSQLAADLPAELRAGTYSLGLLLTDDASIAALNNTWRHRNEPTDVLSFAALESDLEAGLSLPLPAGLVEEAGRFEDDSESDDPEGEDPEGEDPEGDDVEGNDLDTEPFLDREPGLAWESSGEPLELGDIVISLESAARQAAAAGTSLEAELQFLASHGLLHLLGWDHPDEASLATMLSRQEALITGA